MRRFRFRLEKFLIIRGHRETEWEIKLAKAAGACLATERRIDDNQASIMRSFFYPGPPDPREKGVDLEGMRSSELYRAHLQEENSMLRGRLEGQRAELEEVRGHYLDASRERKVLDKLKERRREEYAGAQKREEFKALDEVNASAPQRARAADGEGRI